MPLGTSFTFAGATPESTKMRRTYSEGTQTSLTSSSRVTHSAGKAPYSQGWMRTQGPLAGGSQRGGHSWRAVTVGGSDFGFRVSGFSDRAFLRRVVQVA